VEQDKKMVRDFYNEHAHIKAKQFADLRPGGRARDVARAFWLFDKDYPRVVEIGCGNGREAKLILKHTSNYLGIDLSQTMIELAKENNPGANFLVMDAQEFLFPAEVDIVFSFASLLHCDIAKATAILREAYEALSMNGIIYLSLKYGKYERVLKSDLLGVTPVYFYTPELIVQMLDSKMWVIFTEVEALWSTKWFTMILQK